MMIEVAPWPKKLEPIFNGFSYLVSAIFKIVADFETFEYRFMAEQSYRDLIANSTDPYDAQQICTAEIVQRAHVAAVTSLIRADRWLKGIVDAFEKDNLFAFAACFRGFLESCADSHYALGPVPRAFATHAEAFHECLNKIPRREIYHFDDLEDRLIHYSHGRKLSKSELAPESHRARHIRDYLEYLQKHGGETTQDFYAELCEVTHPAADSVWCMLRSADGLTIELNKDFDTDAITSVCKRNETTIDWLFKQCIGPAFGTLGLINLMNIKELQTSALRHIDLSITGKWVEFSAKVSSAFAIH